MNRESYENRWVVGCDLRETGLVTCRTRIESCYLIGENDSPRYSSNSGPLFLPIQEWNRLPFLLATPYELFDEWFIVKCAFDILRLVRTMSKDGVTIGRNLR